MNTFSATTFSPRARRHGGIAHQPEREAERHKNQTDARRDDQRFNRDDLRS